MSSSAKGVDPAFQGVGQRPGTEIWRIEDFQPVPLPKADYGKFYMGDSYVILQTTQSKGGAYLYDIHFWLGRDTSQDEAGTAAIKTVELDAALGGRAVQHREIQSHESDKFLSYFKPCIIPIEGGVASGFKAVEEEKFETRLYICKGKRVVRMKQVPFARSSLNHDDVFILDTENKIYQFNGANSNIQERAKALEVIQFLKEKYHDGMTAVAIVDDGKLDTESDSGEFWVLFGGFAPLGKRVASDDDIIPETTPATLYSITNGELKVIEGELSKSMLENSKCYLLDCGAEIFVWVGRITQLDERKAAIQVAEEFIAGQNRPKSTRVTRLVQGYETNSFKYCFDTWPAGSSTTGTEEGRGKVAALLKQQGVGLKALSKSTPVNEEVPQLLNGGGKLDVWRINGSAKTPLPAEDVGKFYSGDCYVILYTYHSGERKEDYLLCSWYGKDSVEEDQKMAARLANTMSNSLKGRPVQGRIYQGREPPQFIALFHPMVVLKGGLSSGYKKHVTEKGVVDESYTGDSVALLRISGTSTHNYIAMQVDTVATSLNSCESFVLQSGSSVFIWQGNQCTFEHQQFAAKVAEFLKPGVAVKHAKEGTESSAFWFPLGGKQSYTSKKAAQEIVRDPHLYSFSFIKGKFQVEEIHNFSQDDLLTEDILILDTHAEVFVWVGQSVDLKEKQNAFEFGQTYVEMAVSLDGLSSYVPLYKVTEGNEPCFFTTYFSWDHAKAIVQGNSFQKKATLLLGIGHVVEEKSNGGQGGPTQRASALAALSSAFNPASDKSTLSRPTLFGPWKGLTSLTDVKEPKLNVHDKPNESNHDGPRQRAEALAALSSAFNSASASRAFVQKLSASSQGSQRAAAVAALSSVLTAEKKSHSPDSSPPPSNHSPPSETTTPGGVQGEAAGENMSPFGHDGDGEGDSHLNEDAAGDENESDAEAAQSIFSYDQLKAKSDNPVRGIDFKRREAYLSEEEFQTVFGMDKEAFYKLPKWKQDMQKKKLDLF